MKILDTFIVVLIILTFLFSIFGYNFYTIDTVIPATQTMSTTVPLFTFKQTVYVYPDSIKATIENGFFILHKNKELKVHEVLVENYTILYVDKTGKINRLKHVNPKFLNEKN